MPIPLADVAAELAQRNPEFDESTVAAVVAHANDTVIRLLGYVDLRVAYDLAQLRLDVHRAASTRGAEDEQHSAPARSA